MTSTAFLHSRCRPAQFQTREADGDLYIEGYFAVFGARYKMWDGAEETILPGAFTESLARDDIRALTNHDSGIVLGRTSAGTLFLQEDDKGLFGRIKINRNDVDAMNLYSRVQRGDVDQCSFGFDIEDEKPEEDLMAGAILWQVQKVRLYEVSVVTFPAYEETSVQARRRDYDELRKQKRAAWQNAMLAKLKGEKHA